MMKTLGTNLALGLAGLFGVAAIVFGESDDAPGLVLFGLLIIVSTVVMAVKPSFRRGRFVLGFVAGTIALTVVGALIGGWLENTF